MKNIFKMLLVICLVFSFSGCSNAVEEGIKYDPEKAERQKKEFGACLTESFAVAISKNKKKVKDIPLSDIIKEDVDISFYQGKVSGNDRYIIIDLKSNQDRIITEEFDKYFLKYYKEFYFSPGSEFYVYAKLSNASARELISNCSDQVYGKTDSIPYYAEEFSSFGFYPTAAGNENVKDLIYSDDEYDYYSYLFKGEELLLHFHLNGLKTTVKNALEQKYITFKQLEKYDTMFIKEKKESTK